MVLPCRISVYTEAGETRIGMIEPERMLGVLSDDPALDAIARGQYEAGTALGLKPLQVFRYIVLKPALRIIFPALSGQFVLTLLTTSIVSSISAEELTSIAQSIDTLTFRSFEIYIVATILYLTMSFGFATLFKLVDRLYFSYPVK
ncbi:MAG: ABC transporter permease subunit [Bosea sp.]|nr:ABC transporter permease subunit [Bosea sp. (in: a-proteobacteria)]